MTQIGDETAIADELPQGLASVFRVARVDLAIVDRRPLMAGTVPKEIVKVRVGHTTRVVFCKHGAATTPRDHSRRRGVAFEERVYNEVLQTLGPDKVELLGSFRRADSGVSLVFEFLDDAVRLSEAPRPTIISASEWLGRFHARCVAPESSSNLGLFRHDAAQLRVWAGRTIEYSEPIRAEVPWIPAICGRVGAAADELMSAPPCLLHGEFTVHNVLLSHGRICPVDWESAGVGPGEVDLAMLTENWPARMVARCISKYASARFGSKRMTAGQRTAVVRGQLYATLRWLGDSPPLAMRLGTRWRYGNLLAYASECGLA